MVIQADVPSKTKVVSSHASAADQCKEDRLRLGGETVLVELFEKDTPRLERMLLIRMSQQLRRRVDADDVLQETWLRIRSRYGGFIDSSVTHFYVWLYQQASQTLIDLHRRHCVAQSRNVNCEVPVSDRWWNPRSSNMISDYLAASLTSPSEVASRHENIDNVRATLDEMEAIDKEIMTLCHFEGLSLDEVAELVGLKPATARTRYYKSLRKLKQHLCTDIASDAPLAR